MRHDKNKYDRNLSLSHSYLDSNFNEDKNYLSEASEREMKKSFIPGRLKLCRFFSYCLFWREREISTSSLSCVNSKVVLIMRGGSGLGISVIYYVYANVSLDKEARLVYC